MAKRAKEQYSVENLKDNRFVWSTSMTLIDIGNWFKEAKQLFKKPYYIGIDYSKFDSSQRRQHFDILESIYKKALSNFKDKHKVVEAYCLTLKNAKTCTYYNYKEISGFKVQIPVSRASGDPDTSYGNTMLNQLILNFVFNYLDIQHYQTILGGDDSFNIVEESDAGKIGAILDTILGLGIKATCEHSSFYGDVTYNCKMFVEVEGGYGLVPLLGRVLVRAPLTTKSLKPDEMKLLKSAKSTSVSHEVAIFKPISKYYEKLAYKHANPDEVSKKFKQQYCKKLDLDYNDCRAFVPNDSTYEDVARRYKISAPELIDFVNTFEKRSLKLEPISGHVVDMMLIFDNKELQDGDDLKFALGGEQYSGPVDLAAWQGKMGPGILYNST
jgi:hypothetical protein